MTRRSAAAAALPIIAVIAAGGAYTLFGSSSGDPEKTVSSITASAVTLPPLPVNPATMTAGQATTTVVTIPSPTPPRTGADAATQAFVKWFVDTLNGYGAHLKGAVSYLSDDGSYADVWAKVNNSCLVGARASFDSQWNRTRVIIGRVVSSTPVVSGPLPTFGFTAFDWENAPSDIGCNLK